MEMRIEELQQAHLSIDLPVLPVDICKMVDALWYHFVHLDHKPDHYSPDGAEDGHGGVCGGVELGNH